MSAMAVPHHRPVERPRQDAQRREDRETDGGAHIQDDRRADNEDRPSRDWAQTARVRRDYRRSQPKQRSDAKGYDERVRKSFRKRAPVGRARHDDRSRQGDAKTDRESPFPACPELVEIHGIGRDHSTHLFHVAAGAGEVLGTFGFGFVFQPRLRFLLVDRFLQIASDTFAFAYLEHFFEVLDRGLSRFASYTQSRASIGNGRWGMDERLEISDERLRKEDGERPVGNSRKFGSDQVRPQNS